MDNISLISAQNGVYSLELSSLIVSKRYRDISASRFGVSYIGKSTNYLAGLHSNKAILSIWNDRCDPIYKVSVPEVLKSCAFQEDGGLLYAGGLSGTIYIWILSTGQLLGCWLSHYKQITKIEIVRNNSIIITSSDDNYIQAFLISDLLESCLNMNIPKPIMRWQGHSGSINDFIFSYGLRFSDNFIVTVGSDYTVNFLTFKSERPVVSLNISTELLSCAITDCGKQLFIGCGNGTIYYIKIEDKNKISLKYASKLFGHSGAVNSCKCIKNKLFSSGLDGVRIWNINSGTCIMKLTQFGSSIISILGFSFSNDYINLKLPPFKSLQKNTSVITEVNGINISIEDRREKIKLELFYTSDMIEYVSYIHDSRSFYSELIANLSNVKQFKVDDKQLSILSPENIIKDTIERCIQLERSILDVNICNFEGNELNTLLENVLPFSMYSELKASKKVDKKSEMNRTYSNKNKSTISSSNFDKAAFSDLKKTLSRRHIPKKTFRQQK
ncbi:WD repeat protein [Cryptosporidium ryanae]|uniref:WD repeat protein n=1 Tax=Cryptosporidium ryanae TaxID=515981 RepID=UPI00351A922C|nr:WD repeat protein [Cryptosporidium ryanae]